MTAASSRVPETERGWVLGLSAAGVAVCVFLSGFLTRLLSTLPVESFLVLGGVLVLIAILPALAIRPVADVLPSGAEKG